MKWSRGVLGLALGALACSAADLDAGDASDGRVDSVAKFERTEVERDLTLELTQAIAAPYENQKNPRLEVELENRSLTTSYSVVIPDDGSDAGWREPSVGFTLEGAIAGGEFSPLALPRVSRCGVYAEQWQKDVRTLAPGARLALSYFPFYRWPERDDLARIRFVAHYSYGEHARDLSKVPRELHGMPSYALASEPLELEVARPLELRVRSKGGWPAGPSAPLSDNIEVELENHSTKTLPYGSPEQGARLWFEVELAGERYPDFFDLAGDFSDVARDGILPGEVKSLLRPESRTAKSSLFPPKDKVVRFRARYHVFFEDADTVERRAAWGPNERSVVSDWAPLRD